jgi:hypothetical protein
VNVAQSVGCSAGRRTDVDEAVLVAAGAEAERLMF